MALTRNGNCAKSQRNHDLACPLVFGLFQFYIRGMVRKVFAFIPLFFVFSATAQVISEKPEARSSGGEIIVTWKVLDESGVQRYDILRSVGSINEAIGKIEYVVVGSVSELKGNNSIYTFVDKSAFKSTDRAYLYKIRIINGENPPPETQPVSVTHISSTAKRTWGSIKAMFR